MSHNIAGRTVGPIGFGMMSLTMPGKAPSTDDSIAILKAALNNGANFWNAGHHYGREDYNSLHLLKAYFEKYPEDAKKVVISVKSCFDLPTRQPLNNAKGVKASIERCLEILDGKCRIDLFQPARLDPKVPVEETIGAIVEYVKAGKIGGVGLSECSAASIRKAVKLTPIVGVEVELSMFETGILHNGVAEACKEFNIPIVAYSPLSRGFLTGSLRKYEDMPENDFRKWYPRFQKEVFHENVKLVEAVETIAQQKGCSSTQIAIAWVSAQTQALGCSVIPIPGTASMARMKENTTIISLSSDELKSIDDMLKKIEVKGGRNPKGLEHLMEV